MNGYAERESMLMAHGVHPTAVRLLVLGALEEIEFAFSLGDACDRLPTVDRSTLFRTLQVFADAHLLHVIDDGSKQRKYCLCHNTHRCRPEELHCHFHCQRCDQTFCLPTVNIPVVQLPEGFTADEAEYVLQGLCPRCRRAISGK